MSNKLKKVHHMSPPGVAGVKITKDAQVAATILMNTARGHGAFRLAVRSADPLGGLEGVVYAIRDPELSETIDGILKGLAIHKVEPDLEPGTESLDEEGTLG